MPTLKVPCLRCKEQHQRCDLQKPRCSRCQKRNIHCEFPSKETKFLYHELSALLADAQKEEIEIENESPKLSTAVSDDCTFSTFTGGTVPQSFHVIGEDPRTESTTLPSFSHLPADPELHTNRHAHREGPLSHGAHYNEESASTSIPKAAPFWLLSVSSSSLPVGSVVESPQLGNMSCLANQASGELPLGLKSGLNPAGWRPGSYRAERSPSPPLNLQAECLMQCYIDNVAPWFDVTDPKNHFQRVIPNLAYSHDHLLKAIFAVSATHLTQSTLYSTSRGINYKGRLLANLGEHTPAEYMQQCIPALRYFHNSADEKYRASILASAIILKHLCGFGIEEKHGRRREGGGCVDCLPLLNTALRAFPSQAPSRPSGLLEALYWAAASQEIYYCFARQKAPQTTLSASWWDSASDANKVVLHTLQVMDWGWSDQSEQEWSRLVRQQVHLEQDVLAHFQPVYKHEVNRAKGKVLPSTWFGSDIAAISIQQSILARSILKLKTPNFTTTTHNCLDDGDRPYGSDQPSTRLRDQDLRLLTLEACGIAQGHPTLHAALLQAAFMIQLYGGLFTDDHERRALREMMDQYHRQKHM